MDRNEVIDLLTIAVAFDQRTIGEGDVVAWSTALEGTEFAGAREAVFAHYKDQTRRIMPADIRSYLRQNRRPEAVPFRQIPRAVPDEPNREFLNARDELTTRMAARDREAMSTPRGPFTEQDSSDRAADWIDRNVGPSKYPADSGVTMSATDRWFELPGDPPELRRWLAAQRRAASQ